MGRAGRIETAELTLRPLDKASQGERMVPLILYAAFAGGMGWAISKKKWGATAFFAAMLIWMIVNQFAIAISMRPVLN